MTWGRLDAVEVIGPALETMCSGAGARGVAGSLGLGRTTVRDWRRRFARRAGLLAVGFCRYVAARRRFEGVGGLWRLVNAVVGGHLLSTNTDPPWATA